MDFSVQRAQIDALLKSLGSSCKLTPADTDSPISAFGVVLSAQSDPDNAESYNSNTEKVVYLSGKLKTPPEKGDAITFKPNLYIVKDVRAIAVGEGIKNVFAYRCVVAV